MPFALAWLAEANLIAGRRDIARQLAERALDRFRQHKERGNEAWALRLHGEIAAAVEPPEVEQVESYYRQALALAEELGMRPFMAHCHLGLGTLYQKIGRQEPALTELTTAAELYRATETTFWLERAKLELLKVGDGPGSGCRTAGYRCVLSRSVNPDNNG
ncbi:MAG TPA: tetratricopeptide repeat protein [Chloroflexota bacterium]|nr:tetratricopeptide repeat protein [Chloroflexota bacterium]